MSMLLHSLYIFMSTYTNLFYQLSKHLFYDILYARLLILDNIQTTERS
jgi:hypothetical protein